MLIPGVYFITFMKYSLFLLFCIISIFLIKYLAKYWQSFLTFFYNNVVCKFLDIDHTVFFFFCAVIGMMSGCFLCFGYFDFLMFFWLIIIRSAHNYLFPSTIVIFQFITCLTLIYSSETAIMGILLSFLDIIQITAMYFINKKFKIEPYMIHLQFILTFILTIVISIFLIHPIYQNIIDQNQQIVKISKNINSDSIFYIAKKILQLKFIKLGIKNSIDFFKFLENYIIFTGIKGILYPFSFSRIFYWLDMRFFKKNVPFFYYIGLSCFLSLFCISFFYQYALLSFIFFLISCSFASIFIVYGFELLWHSNFLVFYVTVMIFFPGYSLIAGLFFIGFLNPIFKSIREMF